ncbi:pleckstrin homology domain-containing family S member 1-like isoform X2 [Melanotaenia boesemani]|uniref:pleckstrin homology domain-containing family S member 1-like isoform X2 n=1 Tax=Melanotaenia boesemani TaxID=1250792 RepID=UPI001C052680|nr:pleckstrin homology domain-containing family S member 1-like isoform X2 [Melanotaenia boesemani]
MNKSQKNSGTTVFYKPPTDATKIRSGYLIKSPPHKHMQKEKSWKRRYFVLYKISENEYYFKYFKNPEDTDEPVGGIELSGISLLYGNPEHHQKWGSVPKSFRGSPSCVLYIRSAEKERDYFLVGQSSEEVDGWFSDLFDALKNRPYKFLNTEEIPNGQAAVEICISAPSMQKNDCAAEFEKVPSPTGGTGPNQPRRASLPPPLPKPRSKSDPSSDALDNDTEIPKDGNYSRRCSEPVPPKYDIPRSNKRLNGVCEAESVVSTESVYETMKIIIQDDDREVAEVNSGSLLRSVTQVFDQMKTQVSPTSADETAAEDREDKRQSSDFSSSSSGAISPVENLERKISTNYDRFTAQEREFEVTPSDLKKHLQLTEVEGRPSVSGWTGQPQSVCLFHKGDQILAINDLHICSVEEFNMFTSKSLKNEVKLTILRLPGCQPLHLPNCHCSD